MNNLDISTETKCSVQKEYFSIEQCNNNPDKLYVFGDNTIRKGTKGQAQIRNCSNSFGICTKWSPSTIKGAYFIDTINCLELVERDISELLKYKRGNLYKEIVFPSGGLGTGLSKMPEKCPLLYKRLNKLLLKHFNVNLS